MPEKAEGMKRREDRARCGGEMGWKRGSVLPWRREGPEVTEPGPHVTAVGVVFVLPAMRCRVIFPKEKKKGK